MCLFTDYVVSTCFRPRVEMSPFTRECAPGTQQAEGRAERHGSGRLWKTQMAAQRRGLSDRKLNSIKYGTEVTERVDVIRYIFVS